MSPIRENLGRQSMRVCITHSNLTGIVVADNLTLAAPDLKVFILIILVDIKVEGIVVEAGKDDLFPGYLNRFILGKTLSVSVG